MADDKISIFYTIHLSRCHTSKLLNTCAFLQPLISLLGAAHIFAHLSLPRALILKLRDHLYHNLHLLHHKLHPLVVLLLCFLSGFLNVVKPAFQPFKMDDPFNLGLDRRSRKFRGISYGLARLGGSYASKFQGS